MSTRVLGYRKSRHWVVALEFKPQDCWLGVFWDNGSSQLHVWVCILPMFPIHIAHLREAG